jgi:hypothetical protein
VRVLMRNIFAMACAPCGFLLPKQGGWARHRSGYLYIFDKFYVNDIYELCHS